MSKLIIIFKNRFLISSCGSKREFSYFQSILQNSSVLHTYKSYLNVIKLEPNVSRRGVQHLALPLHIWIVPLDLKVADYPERTVINRIKSTFT